MPYRALAAASVIAALCACQVDAGDSPPDRKASPDRPEANAQANVADGTRCGADKVTHRWLNALPTADVKSAIAATVGSRPIRYYDRDEAITMDFSEARLNVELGAEGRIKRFRCG